MVRQTHWRGSESGREPKLVVGLWTSHLRQYLHLQTKEKGTHSAQTPDQVKPSERMVTARTDGMYRGMIASGEKPLPRLRDRECGKIGWERENETADVVCGVGMQVTTAQDKDGREKCEARTCCGWVGERPTPMAGTGRSTRTTRSTTRTCRRQDGEWESGSVDRPLLYVCGPSEPCIDRLRVATRDDA
jgi:hypothetical protein